MTHEEYEEAALYWQMKDAEGKKADRETLLREIGAYIAANDTCALATGAGAFVRCTPIEYSWRDGAFWMFSEGGLKFAALEQNPNVCLAIFDKYGGFGKLHGMQVTGEARIIEPFTDQYVRAAEVKNIPIEALKKLPSPMHLICVLPTAIDFLSSDFKELGFDVRQHIDF